MKYSIAFLAVGASFAAAQSLSDLPACGQVCVTNMINIASAQFGCSSGDVKCYCTNSDFGYGIRDCSNESCSADDAAKVISFGTSYCQQALASASVTTGGSALSILSSAAATATQTGGSASASSTAITTVPLVATVSASNTVYATTTGFSTVYSQLGASGSLASDASSLSASASSVASSLAASASSVASSLAASASSAASSAASAASSKASSATASGSGSAASSSGLAPRMTAAPILGAAAMGALLFF